MQPKTTLKYLLFSVLLLFAVAGNAVAVPVIDAEKAGLAKHLPVTADEQASPGSNMLTYDYCLPNVLLSHAPVTQTGIPQTAKRVLADKDLLLLHAARYSKTVKASKGNHFKYADNLTHVFLFLFPYHFFW